MPKRGFELSIHSGILLCFSFVLFHLGVHSLPDDFHFNLNEFRDLTKQFDKRLTSVQRVVNRFGASKD